MAFENTYQGFKANYTHWYIRGIVGFSIMLRDFLVYPIKPYPKKIGSLEDYWYSDSSAVTFSQGLAEG